MAFNDPIRNGAALLFVTLNHRGGTDLCSVGILSKLPARVTLTQQIPALVEFNFDLIEARLIAVGQLSWA